MLAVLKDTQFRFFNLNLKGDIEKEHVFRSQEFNIAVVRKAINVFNLLVKIHVKLFSSHIYFKITFYNHMKKRDNVSFCTNGNTSICFLVVFRCPGWNRWLG